MANGNEGTLTKEEETAFAAATQVGAAEKEREALLADVADNRDAVIYSILAKWIADPVASVMSGDWPDDLAAALAVASTDKLFAIEGAEQYIHVQQILRGQQVDSSTDDGDLTVPLGIGDATEDYVYTAVPPCRIIDTRVAGGAIVGGSTRGFYVGGSGATLAGQGGNAAGCPFPKGGEPNAAHINFTAVPANLRGNLRAYPYLGSLPNTSTVNFQPYINIGNAATVQTCDLCGYELNIYASSTTHVVADVLGYYYDVDENIGLDFMNGNWGADELGIDLTNLYQTIAWVSVSAPESGYVSCLGTGSFDYDVPTSTSYGRVGWTTSSTAVPAFPVLGGVAGATNNAVYDAFAAHGVFPQAAGTTTYYLRAVQWGGAEGDMDILLNQASCIYVENRY
jgi:hypothetical protein